MEGGYVSSARPRVYFTTRIRVQGQRLCESQCTCQNHYYATQFTRALRSRVSRRCDVQLVKVRSLLKWHRRKLDATTRNPICHRCLPARHGLVSLTIHPTATRRGARQGDEVNSFMHTRYKQPEHSQQQLQPVRRALKSKKNLREKACA